MMSDSFVFDTQVLKNHRATISEFHQSRHLEKAVDCLSQDSFIARNRSENFGDWGYNSRDSASFSYSNNDESFGEPKHDMEQIIEEPLSPQKEGDIGDGFNVMKKGNFPKFPISKREIRKVSLQGQNDPVIIFGASADLEGATDHLVKSPVNKSMSTHNKRRSEPVRSMKRSVSDVGSFRPIGATKHKNNNESSPNFRDLWQSQKDQNELSLSFSQRRRPMSNRELLKQIGERRPSFRNLYQKLKGEDEQEPQDQTGDNDEADDPFFEGTLPLKAASPTTAVAKKRTSSKDRLNKSEGSEAHLNEIIRRQPSRKSSIRSSGSGSRRPKTRKPSLSDSSRSRGRKNRETDTNYETNPTGVISQFSSDPERESLLDEVRRSRSARKLMEKENRDSGPRRPGSRRTLSGGNTGKSGRSKKTKARDAHPSSEEIGKYSSRVNSRRAVVRRSTMTGNIVDHTSDRPRETRRASMDHYRHSSPSGRAKERRRRATMEHIIGNSPSNNLQLSNSPDYPKKSKSQRDAVKSLTRKDITAELLFTSIGDEERHPFPSPVKFGEEGTDSTQEGSDSFRHTQRTTSTNNQSRPPARKSSVASRGRVAPRKSRSGGESRLKGEKSKERSHSVRKMARTRPDLDRQRTRTSHSPKKVTVEEILAMVASTPKNLASGSFTPKKDNRRISKVKRMRSSEELKGANGVGIDRSARSGGSGSSRDSHERRRSRSTEGSPRKREMSRSRRSQERISMLYKAQKGKRDDRQSDREASSSLSFQDSPVKKNKPTFLGKESRFFNNRRGSAQERECLI